MTIKQIFNNENNEITYLLLEQISDDLDIDFDDIDFDNEKVKQYLFKKYKITLDWLLK